MCYWEPGSIRNPQFGSAALFGYVGSAVVRESLGVFGGGVNVRKET